MKRRTFVGALLGGFATPGVGAQTAPVPGAQKTFAEVLEALPWDVEKRGPLVAVISKASAPSWPANKPLPQTLSELTSTLTQVSARRIGSVWVIGPSTVLAINEHPGPPNLLAARQTRDDARDLLDTLTPAQWQLLGGSTGLGYDDLTDKQRVYFERYLPRPLRISWTKQDKPTHPASVLGDAERRQVRLTAVLLLFVSGRYRKDHQRALLSYLDRRKPPEQETITVDGGTPYDENDDDVNDDGTWKEYGQKLVWPVPHTIKPADLSLQTEQVISVLPDAPAKTQTVETLIARIARACSVELYVDRRLAKQTAWVCGDQAMAGDLLRALCFAVGGTVRRVAAGVESAYVLTDDRDGFAARRARIDEWWLPLPGASTPKSRRVTPNPVQYVTFDPREPVPLSSEQMKRLLSPLTRSKDGRMTMKLNELGPQARAHLEQQAQQSESGNGGYAIDPIDPSELSISAELYVCYILPDGTRTGNNYVGKALEYLDASNDIPSPPPLGQTVLLAQASDAKEGRAVVAQAAKQKLAGVWLAVPETENGKNALVAAAETAKALNLPLWAAPSLLRPTPASPGLPLDVNVLGETSAQYARRHAGIREPTSYLDTGSEAVFIQRTTYLRDLVQTPHLTGVVLRDTVAPGYREKELNMGNSWSGDPSAFHDGPAAGLGYTATNRLAYLRQAQIDPTDIVPYQFYSRLETPFLDAQDELAASGWAAWRHKRGTDFSEKIHADLRHIRPDLPVLWGGSITIPCFSLGRLRRANVFVSDPTTTLPNPYPVLREESEDSYSVQTRPKGGRVWLDIGGQDGSAAYADRVWQRFGPGWDGYVLDLSHLAWSEAAPLFVAFVQAATTPTKETL